MTIRESEQSLKTLHHPRHTQCPGLITSSIVKKVLQFAPVDSEGGI
jgi:hypothetical protein